MRKIQTITIHSTKLLALALLFIACGGKEETSLSALIAEGDLTAIRAKKKELAAQQKELNLALAQLDAAIVAQSDDANYPLITVQEVIKEDFVHFIELQGGVTTRQNVLVYPEVAGTLLSVRVEEGDKVKAGQLLATIDDGGLANQLIQMKAQLSLAKTTFERQQRLWDQNIGSEIQYLQAKTNFESQQAATKQMEEQLGKYSIRAPFDGIIDDVIKDRGTVVAPGQGAEVFRIVNLSNMFIEVAVPETYISTIKKGKKVKVAFPILGESMDSYVRETGNFINPNNRSFTAEIPIPNEEGKVKPNLTAKVQINDYRNEEALLIPQSTISENADGEQYVYLVSDISKENLAIAVKAIITTGKTQGDYVEVSSGIEPGQSIIIEGARSVKEGQKVKILKG